MSRSGQSNYKGTNTQAKAALYLFLSEAYQSDLESVILEDPNWEDFTFIYASGKKVIYESKDHGSTISWAGVKKILNNIRERPDKINEGDEIVIVCNKVTPHLLHGIPYLEYDLPDIVERFKSKGFNNELISLLKKTRFYVIPRDENGDDILYEYALKEVYSILPLWIPEKSVASFLDSILIHEIYEKSQDGGSFSKSAFLKMIDQYKDDVIKSDGTYDTERRGMEAALNDILEAVDSPPQRFQLEGNRLSSISAQPQLAYFLIERLQNSKDLDLSEWDQIWDALIEKQYASIIARTFEKNIDTEENSRYVIEFLIYKFESLSNPNISNHNQEYMIRLISTIIDKHASLSDVALSFVENLLSLRGSDYRLLETKREYSYEKEIVGELLDSLFEITSTNKLHADRILALIFEHFDLISDSGSHSLFTPKSIFEVLNKYIMLNFESNFPIVVSLLTSAYPKARISHSDFDGWDHVGGTTIHWGNEVSIVDKHFIVYSLIPSLQSYYEADPEKAWTYIQKSCLSKSASDVSKESPDFLNRSILDILLDQYSNGTKHRNEAFEILKEFITMKKGIPDKSSLIFQKILLSDKMTDTDKWNLVSHSLNKSNGLPENEFIEKITLNLALKNHKIALRKIAEWIKNPKYSTSRTLGSTSEIDYIEGLLYSDASFPNGLDIFIDFIGSKGFIESSPNFATFNISKAIAFILGRKYSSGLAILNKLYGADMSESQQAVLTGSLEHADGNSKLIINLYNQFLKPILNELSNNSEIEKVFTLSQSRESIVKYADKLTKAGHYKEGLEILYYFVNDKDPEEVNDQKPESYRKHILDGTSAAPIHTVRVWCANVLRRYAYLEAREYSSEGFTLLKILIDDKDPLVRIHALDALEGFVRNRHTVLPADSYVRFMPIELADEIEKTLFNVLSNKENKKIPMIMNRISSSFANLRNLDEETAYTYLSSFADMDDEQVIEPLTGLFLFYAEYRESIYDQDSYIPIFGKRLDSIKKFNSEKMQALLINVLERGNCDIVSHFSWLFWKITKDAHNNFDQKFELSVKYLSIAANTYSNRAYESIYYFIAENMEAQFDKCFSLWKICIENESKFFREAFDESQLHEAYWWPFLKNGQMLVKILENKGEKEFLKYLDILLDYPKGVTIASDLDKVVACLKEMRSNRKVIQQIFEKLLNRNTQYLYAKKEWEELVKSD